MAQVTETVARGILAGQGYTDNEVRQLAHHWLAPHGQAPAGAAQEEGFTESQILAITTAYEQGVGKGRQAHSSGKAVRNPYSTGWRCDLAWQYGYEEGQDQAKQGAQAAPSVLEDAARYHYLRDVPMERWPVELLTAIRLQQNAKWDDAIDAARAQGGTKE